MMLLRASRLLFTMIMMIVMSGLALTGCKPTPGGTGTPPPTGGATAPATFTLDDPELVRRNNEGVGMMGRFDFEAARVIFAELAAAHPGWLDVRVNEAISIYNRQRDGDEALGLRKLEDVLALAPDHARANYCSAILLMREGDTEAALARFRKVAELDPNDQYAQYYIGQCLEQLGGAEAWDDALAYYARSAEIDPYLRSPLYRMYQIKLRQGNEAEANAHHDVFRRLEDNPRASLVKLVYSKMGPKGEARAVDLARPESPAQRPAGPVFGDAVALVPSAPWALGARTSVSAADLDDDGALDLFVTAALRDPVRPDVVNAVLIGDGSGGFTWRPDHPLAAVPDVNAALWGDWDNDGGLEVYLCRRGPNQLWRRGADGTWTDVTAPTGMAGAALDTVDGLMMDCDHDGDLDVFCVNADGPNELFNNDLDGGSRPLAAAHGLTGDGRGRRVLAVDLDGRRDLDLLVLNPAPPHEVYLNERLWDYVPGGSDFEAVTSATLRALVAADDDADGAVDLHGLLDDGARVVFRRDVRGRWSRTDATPPSAHRALAALDTDGDGAIDVVERDAPFLPVVIEAATGPALVVLPKDGGPRLVPPGPGRFRFASLAFSGRTDVGQSMRSNASGLGTTAAARVGSRWTIAHTPVGGPMPGQSLSPVAIGLGGAPALDFVAIDWSDGIFQSEVALGPGAHLITETQRQSSSCPVLFTWNGTEHVFVTDLLGVGGLGFLLAPGQYAEPRPWENYLLTTNDLVPRDGRFVLKITEPMQEACYLDAVGLTAVDVPAGWSVVLDERMGLADPHPTGRPVFYRHAMTPTAATNDRGEDVLASVRERDDVAAPLPPLDHRFIGRTAHEHVLTLEFPERVDAGPGAPILILDGWVEYPYSQTMFAAWQADAAYRAPTLEARGADGVWIPVLVEFGYPAGMPRRMSVPLETLPAGTSALRLRSNLEVYWDRAEVAWSEPCPDAAFRTLPLATARVAHIGFPKRTNDAQRRPRFDYNDRALFWDTRHQRGAYTAFGPALPLVAERDDAFAIIGPGEEVHVEFDATLPPATGTRVYLLETYGWCKDMDLYTKDGVTLEPLPAVGFDVEHRDTLHEAFNRRFESGIVEDTE